MTNGLHGLKSKWWKQKKPTDAGDKGPWRRSIRPSLFIILVNLQSSSFRLNVDHWKINFGLKLAVVTTTDRTQVQDSNHYLRESSIYEHLRVPTYILFTCTLSNYLHITFNLIDKFSIFLTVLFTYLDTLLLVLFIGR